MKKSLKKLVVVPALLSSLCISSPVSLIAEHCSFIHQTGDVRVINIFNRNFKVSYSL